MKSFFGLLKLSIRNIKRHPVKNTLIGILIILSSILFFFTGTIEENAKQSWREYFARTFLGDYQITSYEGDKRDYSFPSFALPKKMIPEQVEEYLKKSKINYSKRIRLGAAVYNEVKKEFENVLATIVGIDLDKELVHLNNLKFKEGKYEPEVKNGILVWKEIANHLKWKVGSEVTFYIKDAENDTYPYTFKITGILDHKEGVDWPSIVLIYPLVLVPYQYLTDKLSLASGKATDLSIWEEKKDLTNEMSNLAKDNQCQFFINYKGYGTVWGLSEMLTFLGAFLAFFILVILIASTLNLNMLGYFERQKEIGSIIAMGAKPRWVVSLLLLELIIFATIAFIIAVVLYSLITSSGGGIDNPMLRLFFAGKKFKLMLVPQSVISAYITVLLTMFISTIYPIYLTARIKPIEVFREGER